VWVAETRSPLTSFYLPFSQFPKLEENPKKAFLFFLG